MLAAINFCRDRNPPGPGFTPAHLRSDPCSGFSDSLSCHRAMQSSAQGQSCSPIKALHLSKRFVDVWWTESPARCEDLYHYLPYVTDQEIMRARRLRSRRDQWRCIVSRATLRLLLSPYLGVVPREIALIEDNCGKPTLNGSPVAFNTSHSDDLIV